jgi:hypothetical protein
MILRMLGVTPDCGLACMVSSGTMAV